MVLIFSKNLSKGKFILVQSSKSALFRTLCQVNSGLPWTSRRAVHLSDPATKEYSALSSDVHELTWRRCVLPSTDRVTLFPLYTRQRLHVLKTSLIFTRFPHNFQQCFQFFLAGFPKYQHQLSSGDSVVLVMFVRTKSALNSKEIENVSRPHQVAINLRIYVKTYGFLSLVPTFRIFYFSGGFILIFTKFC